MLFSIGEKMAELLFTILFILTVLILAFDLIVGINWHCIFGKHRYVYVGKKSGMTTTNKHKVVGSQRKLYKCYDCPKMKPTENSDYN